MLDQGCDQLIELIKQHDRWVDPEADEGDIESEALERREKEPQLA